MYEHILFKDKTDIDNDFKAVFPDAHFIGSMEKFKGDPTQIEILSSKFSKIGINSIKKFPNLKAIVSRSHRSNVNLDIAKKAGIESIEAKPTGEECAGWIAAQLSKYHMSGPFCFIGYGHIAKILAMYIRPYVIARSSGIIRTLLFDEIGHQLGGCKVFIITVPPVRAITNYYFSQMHEAYIVSISEGETFDNDALSFAIQQGRIRLAIMDIIHPRYRDKLLATGKVVGGKHEAWRYNFDKQKYLKKIKHAIDLARLRIKTYESSETMGIKLL